MAHLIENTLAILRDVMTAHKTAMSGGGPAAQPVALPAAAEPRAEFAMRLLTAVEARYGLDINTLTADKLLRVLQPIALAELGPYVERMARLSADDPQWQALIEQLTVNETYVMRDPEQLQFFATLLPGLIADATAKRRFRLRFWSVGCASGEETYTIAALAHEALLAADLALERGARIELKPPWRVEVLGCDISRRSLAEARAGTYETGPLSSFRGEPPELLRFFPLAASGSNGGRPAAVKRSVHECLRDAVRFEPFNLVADPPPPPGFDAVICRNVLVHFSARARTLANARLQAAVRPGGYLLLGPTDSLASGSEFEALWAPGAVIQRRRAADA
jgi:chemotaxis protein methyltransferase CheR